MSFNTDGEVPGGLEIQDFTRIFCGKISLIYKKTHIIGKASICRFNIYVSMKHCLNVFNCAQYCK